jgi:hypothetical protein
MICVLWDNLEPYVKPVIYLISDKMVHTHNPLNINVGIVIRFNIIFYY